MKLSILGRMSRPCSMEEPERGCCLTVPWREEDHPQATVLLQCITTILHVLKWLEWFPLLHVNKWNRRWALFLIKPTPPWTVIFLLGFSILIPLYQTMIINSIGSKKETFEFIRSCASFAWMSIFNLPVSDTHRQTSDRAKLCLLNVATLWSSFWFQSSKRTPRVSLASTKLPSPLARKTPSLLANDQGDSYAITWTDRNDCKEPERAVFRVLFQQ